MSFTQKVVKHRDEKGRNVRVVVKHSENDVIVRQMLGADVVIFTSQKDSTIHVVQKTLVDEVTIEQEDPKYGTFKKIGTEELA